MLSLLPFVAEASPNNFNTVSVCLKDKPLSTERKRANDLLSCRLPTKAKLPKIIVAGEIHNYARQAPDIDKETLKGSDNSQAFWSNIVKRVIKNDALIATEGLAAIMDQREFGIRDFQDLYNAGHGQFPIEGELELALSGLYHYASFSFRQRLSHVDLSNLDDIDSRIDNLLVNFARNNYLQLAWRKVRRPYRDAFIEQAALDVFDSLLCSADPLARISDIRKILKAQGEKVFEEKARAALIEIFGDLYQNLGELAEERMSDKALSKKINQLIQSKGYLQNVSEFLNEYMTVVNGVRETKMISNLGTAYCALSPLSSDIYVRVGSDHAQLIYESLKQIFSTRGLDTNLIQLVDTTKQ